MWPLRTPGRGSASVPAKRPGAARVHNSLTSAANNGLHLAQAPHPAPPARGHSLSSRQHSEPGKPAKKQLSLRQVHDL